MSSGKKLLLALVLLPVVVYVGIKLYIRHNVKTALDELATLSAPFASVRYDGIGSSLAGKLSIEDVRIKPVGFTDELRIRDIEIRTPGLGYALFGARRLWQGDFPRRLQIALHGLAIDLDGELMGMFEQFVAAAGPADGRGLAHCGGIAFFGPRQYRKLGYETLMTDITLGYEHERQAERLVVRLDWVTPDMASLATEVVLGGGLQTLRTAPRMTELRVVYKDLSLSDRTKRYCADASGISAEDYVNAEVGQSDAAYLRHWGFVPGPGLRAAYRQFLEKPGEVRLDARPADGIDPGSLKLFKPEDAVAMLNLTLSVNGNPVTDLSFSREAADAPAVAAADSRIEPAGREPDKGGYRPLRIVELPKHLGRQVRVHQWRSGVREGTLTEASPVMLTLERQYAGGAMTFKVPVKQIEKVEVLF